MGLEELSWDRAPGAFNLQEVLKRKAKLSTQSCSQAGKTAQLQETSGLQLSWEQGKGLGDALPSREAIGKLGLPRGAWMGAEWDGLARVKHADRRRAWLRTPSLPFCFAAPYRAWGAGLAGVCGSPACGLAVGGVLAACSQGGCILLLSSRALCFSFGLSSYCSTRFCSWEYQHKATGFAWTRTTFT